MNEFFMIEILKLCKSDAKIENNIYYLLRIEKNIYYCTVNDFIFKVKNSQKEKLHLYIYCKIYKIFIPTFHA